MRSTRLRTAAASAVATRALSRPDSKILTIIGNGDLAGAHIDAISAVRAHRAGDRVGDVIAARSKPWSKTCRNSSTRRSAWSTISATGGGPWRTSSAPLTASHEPLIQGEWLKPGQHLNLVGSSLRAAREVDDEVVARGYYIADSRVACAGAGGRILSRHRAGPGEARTISRARSARCWRVRCRAGPGETRSRSISRWAMSPRTYRSPMPRSTRATELAAES